MNPDQKTLFLLKIPNINLFKLTNIEENNIKLIGGNSKKQTNWDIEYNNNSGNFSIGIDNNKYYYRVDRYSSEELETNENIKYKFVDLITIKDKYKDFIDCGSIAIDIENNIGTITSLGSSEKCLKSSANAKFKHGDILFQIMLYICKKEKLIKIELTDNSYLQCGTINLNLNYLKTMTHGTTHYHKYGFKFKNLEDNKILKKNYELFLTDPKITKKKLLSLLDKKNIDKKIILSVNKILDKLPNNEISIKKIVKLYTLDLENIVHCNFIFEIYIELFKKAGYTPYYTKDFELDLE